MTIRSNEDRLGVDAGMLQHQQEAPPMQAVNPAAPQPQLNFVIPTEYVELPSKGEFYPEDHPLYKQTSIEMKHMTAKEEDILTSRTLLKQGVALDRLLQNLIVDRRIKVKDLLIGDKNALIVSARIHGYGASYSTKVSCPSCGEAQYYDFDLNELEIENNFEEVVEEYDIERTGTNVFKVPLPKTSYEVEITLLNGHQEKQLTELAKRRKKKSFVESTTTDQLRAIIVSVNGIEDRSTINGFVNALPSIDARYLRRIYQKLNPNVETTQHFECSECGYEDEMEVPFTTDFFWSNR